MRITTWNINGLRTLRQYRPWYALKDWQACLDYLEADIICFQEVKLTRKNLVAEHRDMCVPEGYEAYYNLHPAKGYAGVATFVKKNVCHVRKAEMGLTGELVSNRQDDRTSIGGYPDLRAPELPVYDQIDQEGRAVIVDCGLFVLFNLYCPNETDEGRREYKMAYYLTLAERVENLLANGREVIIVGDLNIAHLPIDHCEGVNQRTRQEHLDIHPARQWLDQFLAPNGAFHDVTRKFHPTRKFMYTCWDTVKDTRPANYGVRIDYTLVSRNLLPWIKDADIQPNIYGSDHCPVYVDLRDEIQTQDGKTIRLRDVLLSVPATKRKPPSLATSCWPEFAGRRLQSFFAPKAASSNDKTTQSPSPVPGPGTLLSPAPTPSVETTSTAFVKPSPTGGPSPARAVETASIPRPTTEPCKEVERAEKKSLTQGKSSDRGRTSSATVKSPGQMNLRTFFGQKGTPSSQDGEPQTPLLTGQESSQRITHDEIETQSPEKAYQSDSQTESAVPLFDESTATDDGDSSAGRVTSALAWGSIFAPKEPPLCTFHREPARPWTVNKAGPNHGRKFWMCARPVGSGGTGNPNDDRQFRCSFWKWDSDIRSCQSRQDRGADGLERSFHEVAGKAPRLASGEKRGLERSENRAPHKSAVKRQKK